MGQRFWDLIEEAHNQRIPDWAPKRDDGMLKSHFRIVQGACKEFNGYYCQAKRDWPSGNNDADVLSKAETLFYAANKINPFKYTEAWKVLIPVPKFQHIMDKDDNEDEFNKRHKGIDGSSHSSLEGSDGFRSHIRLIGGKVAKQQARNKGKQPTIDLDDVPEEASVQAYEKISAAT